MYQNPNVMLKSIFVPGWVYRGVIRNKHAATDLSNYRVLRSILSIDDMAEFFYVNDRLKINSMYLSDRTLISNFSGLSPEESHEIYNSVLPLSGSEQTASSVKNRLTDLSEEMKLLSDRRDYEFVLVDNTIYIILNEGFLSMCEDKAKRFEFITQLLKKCYFMTSIADVSKMAIFKAYVNHLAS